MAILTAIPLLEATVSAALPLIAKSIPLIQAAYNEAVSDDDFVTKLQKEGVILTGGLAALGSLGVPGLTGTAAIVAGSLNAANSDLVKFGQGVLNTLLAAGKISFGNGVPLVIDGDLGELTSAAVTVIQNKLGLKVTGVIGQIEQAAFTLLANNVTLPKL